MRIGGGAPTSTSDAHRYRTPAEDLFDAFFAEYEDAGPLTLLALKATIEQSPRPSFLEAPSSVREFFEGIAETVGISDP